MIARKTRKRKAAPKHAATAKIFRKALDDLGLTVASQRTATALGLSVRQCQRLATGEQPVPPPVNLLLEMHLKYGLPDEPED